MSRFIIEGSADVGAPRDADGHSHRLLRDGIKVFGGPWACCVEEAYRLGRPGDTLTSGSMPWAVDQPIEESKRHWEDKL